MVQPSSIKMTMVKRFFILFLTAIPPVLAQPPRALPVESTLVKIATVFEEITSVGTLLAEEQVVIRSEIAGRILAIHFSEGQRVAANQLLITLDPAEYEARLAESQAAVKLNRLSFERTKDLLSKNLASHQTYDEAAAKLDESLARQQVDEISLKKTKIVAPFKGILGLRNLSQGAYIKEGQDLVTLVDKSSVKVDFHISEKFLAKVQAGQTVKVHVDAYPNQDFRGQVYALEPVVDEETRTALVRARIPNDQETLSPGMFARVQLVLEARPNAILVPEQAIVPMGLNSFVFKIVNGKAALTKVTLGQRRTGDVEVREGLGAGDKIITSGHLKLRDGAEVMEIPSSKP